LARSGLAFSAEQPVFDGGDGDLHVWPKSHGTNGRFPEFDGAFFVDAVKRTKYVVLGHVS